MLNTGFGISTMKNAISKLTALALLTGLAFSSQAALVTLTVSGSADATVFTPFTLSGAEETARAVSGGDGTLGEVAQEVDSFDLFTAVPALDLNTEMFSPHFAAASATADQSGQFNLGAMSQGNALSRSALQQTYSVQNGAVAGDFSFNFEIQAGFLFAACGANFIDMNSEVNDDVSVAPSVSLQSGEFGNPCGFDFASASYSSSITLRRDGLADEELFNSSIAIVSDENGDVVTTEGTSIGFQSLTLGAGSVRYTISPEQFSKSIKGILANESFTVIYRFSMASSTAGGLLDLENESQRFPYASSFFGDPNSFQGPSGFGNTSLTLVPVSAPGNLAILGLGIAALAFARKRKAK